MASASLDECRILVGVADLILLRFRFMSASILALVGAWPLMLDFLLIVTLGEPVLGGAAIDVAAKSILGLCKGDVIIEVGSNRC